MCNAFAGWCGSFQTVQKPSPTCWEKCLFHESREIHYNEDGSAKNYWSTKTSSEPKLGKEIAFSFLDVIIFA